MATAMGRSSVEKNVETVRSFYAAQKAFDLDRILETLSDDVEWPVDEQAERALAKSVGQTPVLDLRRGKEQVAEFFRWVNDGIEFDEICCQAQEFYGDGDKVVVIGHSDYRVRATGKLAVFDWAARYTMKEGKIARVDSYSNLAKVLPAYA